MNVAIKNNEVNVADTLFYFAYGSNLHLNRLRARVPSAEPVTAWPLDGYDLRWHKRGRDGSGKCDCFRTDRPTDRVHGVIYSLSSDEKPALDAAEGLGVGYDLIWLGMGEYDKVFTYVARRDQIDDVLAPYVWYRQFVIDGARQHSLPAGYVDRLASVSALEDPDRERHALNIDILNGDILNGP